MGMIKDIYMGNNVPIEKSTESIKGYNELHLKWLAAHKEMVGLLNDDQKALFEKLLAMYSELNDLFSTDCYESGFRDGAKLMIEILRGGDADAEIRDLEGQIHAEH